MRISIGDKPSGVIVLERLRSEGMITEMTANGISQFHELRRYFLLGNEGRVIDIKRASDTLPQSSVICSRCRLASSGRSR